MEAGAALTHRAARGFVPRSRCAPSLDAAAKFDSRKLSRRIRHTLSFKHRPMTNRVHEIELIAGGRRRLIQVMELSPEKSRQFAEALEKAQRGGGAEPGDLFFVPV